MFGDIPMIAVLRRLARCLQKRARLLLSKGLRLQRSRQHRCVKWSDSAVGGDVLWDLSREARSSKSSRGFKVVVVVVNWRDRGGAKVESSAT